MNSFRKSIPFIILLCGFAGLVGLSALRSDPPSTPQGEEAPLVETVEARQRNGGFSLVVDGEVVPYREISLAAQVSGKIVKKSAVVRAGRYVKQGDLLFQIDPRDYELEVRRLREAVDTANSSIEEADVEKSNTEQLVELSEEDLALQRREVQRFEGLRDKNAASISQLESVRRAELQAKNTLQTLRNQITLINARRNRLLQEKSLAVTNLDRALLDLSRTEIVSPIDGVVTEDYAEQDDYVQIGSSLVKLEDTSKAEVRFELRMDQLRWLWSNGASTLSAAEDGSESYDLPPIEVQIRLDLAGQEFTWPARLDRYDGAGITATTRTVPIIAVVDHPMRARLATSGSTPGLPAPPTLLRGAFVSIEIPVSTSMNLVEIPTSTLRPGERVWVFDNGRLRIQKVEVAHADDEAVVVVSRQEVLSPGDRIISSPLPMVVDGMPLRRKEVATMAAQESNITGAL